MRKGTRKGVYILGRRKSETVAVSQHWEKEGEPSFLPIKKKGVTNEANERNQNQFLQTKTS